MNKLVLVVILAVLAVAAAKWNWVEEAATLEAPEAETLRSGARILSDTSFDRKHTELVGVVKLLNDLQARLQAELDSSRNTANSKNAARDAAQRALSSAQSAFSQADVALKSSTNAFNAAQAAANQAQSDYTKLNAEIQKELRLINQLKQIIGAQHGCDGATRGRNCYQVLKSTAAVAYATAKQQCSSWYGASVSSIADSTENAYIRSQCPSNTHIWVGGTDEGHEGVWTWDDTGARFQYTNWAPGEPNNVKQSTGDFKNGENHIEMYPDGRWNDIPGTLGRATCWVCKRTV
jgi:hypothetical protein